MVVRMIRRLAWVSCVLGFVAGCGESEGGDEPTGRTTGGTGAVPASGGGSSAAGGRAGAGGLAATGGAAAGGSADAGFPGQSGAAGTATTTGGRTGGGAGSPGDAPPLERVSTVPADKIDLLFVIDNSISMSDKQEIFRDAVPLLVQRLVTPACVFTSGEPTGELTNAQGECLNGEPEFPPIRDIHVGVITSSLGSAGGGVCATGGNVDPSKEDRAHLLPSVRDGLASWNDSGFLAWDPDQTKNAPPGEGDPSAFVSSFQDMVVAAGELGCGYEATLESWYRFLIDPEPPSAVAFDAASSQTIATYPDATILAQREAFLRPDSLVGIAILSDENDCSLLDSGQAYLVGTSNLGASVFQFPRSTSACASDPNDPCCSSCASVAVNPACPDPASDTECQKGNYTREEDHLNLRCYEQKRRFGFDFLQPIARYVDGLTSVQVKNRSGALVANPLFAAAPGELGRDLSRVFLLGIVGVPWQDVADDASQDDPRRLRYLSHDELVANDRWSLLIGEGGEPPGDSLLLETTVDRSTLNLPPHPLTGELPAAASEVSLSNRINGHEMNVVANDDLQYSCIFPRTTPLYCLDVADACDCHDFDAAYNRAICEGTTQTHAKAYPPGRHLELLRAFGDLTGNGIVTSICPKVTESPNPTGDPDYGYNPAVGALVDRMKNALSPTCLAEPIEPDSAGRVGCELFEVNAAMAGNCTACAGPGRIAASASGTAALLERLEETRYCGAAGQPACDELCVCAIEQMSGAGLEACQGEPSLPLELAGFCYVDPAQGFGEPELVSGCPVGRKRRLRFLGEGVPRDGASTFLLCGGG